MGHCLCLDRGSIPLSPARFFELSYGAEHDRTSALTFNQVIKGSIPFGSTRFEFLATDATRIHTDMKDRFIRVASVAESGFDSGWVAVVVQAPV